MCSRGVIDVAHRCRTIVDNFEGVVNEDFTPCSTLHDGELLLGEDCIGMGGVKMVGEAKFDPLLRC